MIKLKSWLEKQEFLDLKGLKDGLEEGLKSDLKDSVNAIRLVLLLILSSRSYHDFFNLKISTYGCHQSAFVDRYKNSNKHPYRW